MVAGWLLGRPCTTLRLHKDVACLAGAHKTQPVGMLRPPNQTVLAGRVLGCLIHVALSWFSWPLIRARQAAPKCAPQKVSRPELAMQDEIGPGVPSSVLEYTVMVLVVAPNRDLAQYIVTTMYPEYESISIPDEPYTPD